MKWFGQSWGAPVNRDCVQAPVPVGERCVRCNKVIEADDFGLLLPHSGLGDETETAFHRDCLLRAVGVDPERAL